MIKPTVVARTITLHVVLSEKDAGNGPIINRLPVASLCAFLAFSRAS